MKFNFTSALIGGAFVLGCFATMAFQIVTTASPYLTQQQQAVLALLSVETLERF